MPSAPVGPSGAGEPVAGSVRVALRSALTAAMRSRDRSAASVYRSVLAALDNAEAVPVDVMPRAGAVESSAVGIGAAEAPRRELTEAEQRAIVTAEAVELRSAAAQLVAHDADRADTLAHHADLLDTLLATLP